jgi:hypothetical protein
MKGLDMFTNRLKTFSFALATCLNFLAASAAQASVIDFTDSTVWGSITGSSAVGAGVTLSASGTNPLNAVVPASLTFNSGACGAASSLGLACQGRGIGIDRSSVSLLLGDVPGEIDRRELLSVNFANPVQIVSIEFLNVARDNLLLFSLNETMSIAFNGGPWQNFTLAAAAPGGYFLTSGFSNANNVSQIDIRGGGALLASTQEGSLARITYVPVPATLALFLIGFTAFAVTRKRG